MNKDQLSFDILIIGAGISGAVLAQRYSEMGKKVLILEKRDHIAGNCYDFIDDSGLLVSKYGPHLFHTNYKNVWKYVQKFSKWQPYQHKVLSKVDNKLVPIPVNITTVNEIFGVNIKDEAEMDSWLKKNQKKILSPKNSEEVALNRVGEVLYQKMFKNYTKKQWNKDPKELDSSVMARIPVKNNFDDRYFSDVNQGQPTEGFTKMFQNILSSKNITVKLKTDFIKKRDKYKLNDFEKVFYTGPVDLFFDSCFGHKGLEYRSLRFEFETFNKEFYQSHPVINYPNEEEYTRIVEYKRITGQISSKTTISKEYPTNNGEPYYPVLTRKNRMMLKKYQRLIKDFGNVHFIGRLAEFRYMNMDEAFKNALDLFQTLEER